MNNEEGKYHSRNPETGLLEDIEEVRAVGIGLAETLALLIQQPLIQAVMPQSSRELTALLISISLRSLQPMSPAEGIRRMAQLLGDAPETAEDYIRQAGLSEEVPGSKPEPKPEQPPINLPSNIESFLNELFKQEPGKES